MQNNLDYNFPDDILPYGENQKIVDDHLFYRTIDFSKTEQSYLIMQKHLQGSNRLFGGQLLSWLDEVAAIVAMRHSQSNVTTACIEQLEFKNPVHLSDTVVIVGYLTHVGNSSMELRVDTYVERLDGSRHPVNRAFFVIVALDENEKAMRVPRLKIENVEQQAKWEAALKRSDLRKQRKREGF